MAETVGKYNQIYKCSRKTYKDSLISLVKIVQEHKDSTILMLGGDRAKMQVALRGCAVREGVTSAGQHKEKFSL